jgi:cytochrome c peroxidase
MKTKTLTSLILLAGMVVFGGKASAEDKPTAEYGKKLFNDPALGGPANTKTCNSCHPSGKGLEKAWSNQDLAGKINICISGPLKGKGLEVNSREMQSLMLYIKSLKAVTGGY